MKIGNVTFAEPFVSLAPLAGYGDAAFRRLCRECGASLTVSEMVSVKGLCYGNEKTESLLAISPCETPSCVQLFGSDPEFFARALRLGVLDRFDIIDINMGCPVPKVTKCGEGGALMKDGARAEEIVRACVQSSGGRPITVKHRTGYADGEMFAPEFAARMERAGAAAITVHGRTVAQGYRGVADWNAIAQAAQAVRIPVIGNGDVVSLLQARKAKEESGCAGVAVGRGALGRPDVFSGKEENVCALVLRHLDYALFFFPENVAVRTMRKHLCRYLSRVSGAKELKARVNAISDAAELKEVLSRELQTKPRK